MGVTFGGQQCLDPLEIAEQFRDQGLATDWVGKPNSYRYAIGPDSGIGWLLLSLQQLANLRPSVKWTAILPAPTNLQAYPGPGDGQITLIWESVDGALGYNIYQGTAPGQESTTPSTTVANSALITNLTLGQAYYFRVSAVFAANLTPGQLVPSQSEGKKSAEAVATVRSVTLPVPPTNLAAFPALASNGQPTIVLNWQAVPGAIGYNVYRSLGTSGSRNTPIIKASGGPDFSPEIIPTAETQKPTIPAVTTNTVTDTGLAFSTLYYYQVTTIGATGQESPRSAEIFVESWASNVYDLAGDLLGSFISPSNPKQDAQTLPYPGPSAAPVAPTSATPIPTTPTMLPAISPASTFPTGLVAPPKIDVNKSYDLVFQDGTNKPVTYQNLRFLQGRCLTPGRPWDPESVYLITICDRRRLFFWANKLLNRNYNLVVQPQPSVTIIESSLEEFGASGSAVTTLITTSQASSVDGSGNLVETTVTVRHGRLRDILTNWKESVDGAIQAAVNLFSTPEVAPFSFYGYEYTSRTVITFPNGDINDTTIQAIPQVLSSNEADMAFGGSASQLIGFKKSFTVTRTDPVSGQKTVTQIKTMDPTQGSLLPFDLTTEIPFDLLNPHAIQTTVTIYQAGQNQTGIAGKIYDNASLQQVAASGSSPGANQLWTWDSMLGDVWQTVGSDFVGQWPGLAGLGFSPSNNPQNITISQKPALWSALALLARLGATIALDPTQDTFKIVTPGAPDNNHGVAETKWEATKLLDDFSFEPDWSHLPQAVEVLFAKQGFAGRAVPGNVDPFWHVLLKDPTATKGTSFGTATINVWEPQLQASLDATQLVVSNWSDVQTRAGQWANYVFSSLHRQQSRMHKTYDGFGPATDPAMQPGNQVRALCCEDRGQGWRTEVIRGPMIGNQFPWDIQGAGDFSGWGGSYGWAAGFGWSWGAWDWSGPGALTWFGFPEQQWGWGVPQLVQ